jgi:hypothetical protein
MIDPKLVCLEIYQETKAFYAQNERACGHLGFKVLYGPPISKPQALFIGYQPGGGPEDCARELLAGAHDRWPAGCEYATESWTLARNMQQMFGRTFLEESVALNAIFIRAPKVEVFRKTVTPSQRARIEEFCLPRVARIIEAIEPRRIISIGFGTLKLFGESSPEMKNDKGRVLTKIGSIAGRDAVATLHLSGARMSAVDRNRIRDRILG